MFKFIFRQIWPFVANHNLSEILHCLCVVKPGVAGTVDFLRWPCIPLCNNTFIWYRAVALAVAGLIYSEFGFFSWRLYDDYCGYETAIVLNLWTSFFRSFNCSWFLCDLRKESNVCLGSNLKLPIVIHDALYVISLRIPCFGLLFSCKGWSP